MRDCTVTLIEDAVTERGSNLDHTDFCVREGASGEGNEKNTPKNIIQIGLCWRKTIDLQESRADL